MTNIQNISKQIERIQSKLDSKKQYCEKHKIGYLYSCSECDLESKHARENAYQVSRLLSRSGIKKRFRSASFENFKPQNKEDTINLKAAVQFSSAFQQMKELGSSIVMIGTTGSGKTYLASSIVREVIIKHKLKAKILTAYNLISSINETYTSASKKTEQQIKNELADYDLLVIDEIDLIRGKSSDHLQLFDVINERYEAMLPTIIISNLDRKELEKFIGQRLMSRILESGLFLRFTGHDKRKVQMVGVVA
ncbi:ATP-binding protein [Thiotrichales bacterium 19S9-12]|nr:ATP-binding protein [Thiotrichales bacterium 19S9-11]MCF6812539.1 ATP-binding protein [Thiotrichales bacterium 19S9-12]